MENRASILSFILSKGILCFFRNSLNYLICEACLAEINYNQTNNAVPTIES